MHLSRGGSLDPPELMRTKVLIPLAEREEGLSAGREE
jgi:hypothetical protein